MSLEASNKILTLEAAASINILTKARELIKEHKIVYLCNAIDLAGGTMDGRNWVCDALKARVIRAIDGHRSMTDYIASLPQNSNMSWFRCQEEAYRRRLEMCDSMIAELNLAN